MAGVGLPHEAIREQLARGLDLIVHMTRDGDGGARRVTEVGEVLRAAAGVGGARALAARVTAARGARGAALAAGAGGLAAVAAREAALATPGAGRWLADALEPLRRAGREGHVPTELERRRLAVVGTAGDPGRERARARSRSGAARWPPPGRRRPPGRSRGGARLPPRGRARPARGRDRRRRRALGRALGARGARRGRRVAGGAAGARDGAGARRARARRADADGARGVCAAGSTRPASTRSRPRCSPSSSPAATSRPCCAASPRGGRSRPHRGRRPLGHRAGAVHRPARGRDARRARRCSPSCSSPGFVGGLLANPAVGRRCSLWPRRCSSAGFAAIRRLSRVDVR